MSPDNPSRRAALLLPLERLLGRLHDLARIEGPELLEAIEDRLFHPYHQVKGLRENLNARAWSQQHGRCWCESPFMHIPSDHLPGCRRAHDWRNDADDIPF